MMRVLAAAILITITPHAWAQDYKCVIEKYLQPTLTQDKQAYWEKLYKGKEFSVDRRTGIMAGALKNSYSTKPQIIDAAFNNGNSYKVVTTMRRDQGAGAGSNVYTLVVNEYAETPKKPFVFLDSDTVYFGTCVHF